MEQQPPKYAWTNKLGIFTGALLLALGIFVLLKRPESGKALPVFMVVYGAFRLGMSVYQSYFKKNTSDTPQ